MPTALTAHTARRVLAGVILIALAAAGLQVGGTENRGALAVGAGLLLVGLLAIVVAIRGPASASSVASLPSDFQAPTGAIQSWLSIHVAAVVLGLVVPHLHLLGLSVGIAVIAGVMLERRLTGAALPQAGPGLTLVLLIGSWFALAGVAGDAPLGLEALRDAPYSEAFEITIALPLSIAAWPLLGLFPFHQARLGPLAPVAGGVLLVRLAAVALPSGLAHWQPLLYLLVLVAMVHALVTRRDAECLAALASVGLLSGAGAGGWCGIGLATGVAVIRSHSLLTATGRVLNARGQLLAQALVVVGALLLAPVLAGGLATEAVYTVLILICAALLLWRR